MNHQGPETCESPRKKSGIPMTGMNGRRTASTSANMPRPAHRLGFTTTEPGATSPSGAERNSLSRSGTPFRLGTGPVDDPLDALRVRHALEDHRGGACAGRVDADDAIVQKPAQEALRGRHVGDLLVRRLDATPREPAPVHAHAPGRDLVLRVAEMQ